MEVHTIYNKYLDAQTTFEEECWLSEALRTDCPPDLLEKRDVLLAMLPKSEPALPKGFVAHFEKGLQAVSHQKTNTHTVLLRWIAGFSSAAVLAGALFLMDRTNSEQREMPNQETAKIDISTVKPHTKQQTKAPGNNTSDASIDTHTKTVVKDNHKNPSMTPHDDAMPLMSIFSEAEMKAAEAEAELIIAQTEANAELCIEQVNREVLIETTEARSEAYIADVEATLSLDIEAAEECIRTTDFNAKLMAQN